MQRSLASARRRQRRRRSSGSARWPTRGTTSRPPVTYATTRARGSTRTAPTRTAVLADAQTQLGHATGRDRRRAAPARPAARAEPRYARASYDLEQHGRTRRGGVADAPGARRRDRSRADIAPSAGTSSASWPSPTATWMRRWPRSRPASTADPGYLPLLARAGPGCSPRRAGSTTRSPATPR